MKTTSNSRPRSSAPVLSAKEERMRPLYIKRAKGIAKMVKDYLSRPIRYNGKEAGVITAKQARNLVHYFLEVSTLDETRRSRRGGKTAAEMDFDPGADLAPTNSLLY